MPVAVFRGAPAIVPRPFAASMHLGTEPAAPHSAIDNRLTSATTLEAQVTSMVTSLTSPGEQEESADAGRAGH